MIHAEVAQRIPAATLETQSAARNILGATADCGICAITDDETKRRLGGMFSYSSSSRAPNEKKLTGTAASGKTSVPPQVENQPIISSTALIVVSSRKGARGTAVFLMYSTCYIYYFVPLSIYTAV